VTLASLGANLGGIALFAAPGFGLTELLAPLRRLGWALRLGYAYLLGTVAVAGSLFAASHLFAVPLRRPAIAAAVLAPCALGLAAWAVRRARRRAAPPPPLPDRAPTSRPDTAIPPTSGSGAGSPGTGSPATSRPAVSRGAATPPARRRWQCAAVVLLAAVGLGSLAQAISVPVLDWDGRMTWNALAAYLRDEGTVDAAILRDARWFVVHPRYPPLLPLAQAAVQETFGAGEDDELFRAFYVGFYAAALLVLYDGARRAAGPLAATLATLCAAAMPFLRFGAGGGASTYSDLPLAAFYGAALVLLLEERTRLGAGLAAGCLLAGAMLTKNEGEFLAIAALLLASWRLLRHRRRPAALARLRWFLAAGLPVAASALLLASWRAGIPNREDEDYFGMLSLSALVRGAVARWPQISHEAARLTFIWFTWHGFWIVFLVVLAAGYPALRRRTPALMLAAGLVPLAIGYSAYAVSDRYFRLVYETWDRLLIQALIPLAIAFACALAHSLRRLRGGRRELQAASAGRIAADPSSRAVPPPFQQFASYSPSAKVVVAHIPQSRRPPLVTPPCTKGGSSPAYGRQLWGKVATTSVGPALRT
jgi:hypothetical protein